MLKVAIWSVIQTRLEFRVYSTRYVDELELRFEVEVFPFLQSSTVAWSLGGDDILMRRGCASCLISLILDFTGRCAKPC